MFIGVIIVAIIALIALVAFSLITSSGLDINPLDNEQQLLDRMRVVEDQLKYVFKYKSSWCGHIGQGSNPQEFNQCVGEHIDELQKEREDIRKKLNLLGSPYYKNCIYDKYC